MTPPAPRDATQRPLKPTSGSTLRRAPRSRQVADAIGLLTDNGYPDAFVDTLYVADETDAHLEWVERLLGK